MNNTATLELVETAKPEPRKEITLTDNSPAGMMMTALRNGAQLEQVEKMMLLQERYEATQARKSYNSAFSEFKAEAVRIVKSTKVTAGPLSGKSYAELYSVVDALTPALSRHGLSASWKLTKDDKEWMEVTCFLRHVDGHEESASMGGPPDAGGAKNAIQARASTKSYLERYTLKAICGVAEGGEDDDGQGAGGSSGLIEEWTDKVNSALTIDVLNTTRKMGAQAFNEAHDVAGWNALKIIVDMKAATLKAAS